jgi:hypothetical protein
VPVLVLVLVLVLVPALVLVLVLAKVMSRTVQGGCCKCLDLRRVSQLVERRYWWRVWVRGYEQKRTSVRKKSVLTRGEGRSGRKQRQTNGRR